VCPVDVLHAVCERFATSVYRELTEQWRCGEISTQQLLPAWFAAISASREEMEAYIDTIDMDPSFADFEQYCRLRGVRLCIVSEGLRWYIDRLLARHGIHGIPVYANEVHFRDAKGVSFSYPWYSDETPAQGTSKSSIVRRFQSEGFHVIYIGDGRSDIEAARAADAVYARGYLLDFTRKHGIESQDFSSFRDLLPAETA
jgi:2,3-diketo-5-methylthio-1-phosphopentane phosphatase